MPALSKQSVSWGNDQAFWLRVCVDQEHITINTCCLHPSTRPQGLCNSLASGGCCISSNRTAMSLELRAQLKSTAHAVAQEQSGLSNKQKIGVWIPSSSSLNSEGSGGNKLNPRFHLMALPTYERCMNLWADLSQDSLRYRYEENELAMHVATRPSRLSSAFTVGSVNGGHSFIDCVDRILQSWDTPMTGPLAKYQVAPWHL
ncbi:unnamed protein product [Pleuronectes platessa]|uniref:Uncharacterized protein n=1 Tax=Pleuronectes platessa TaxID=8262 RepID=A0A9N7VFU4_PLEPL|nr:unnamed protein product [Pleuronectes platessa]